MDAKVDLQEITLPGAQTKYAQIQAQMDALVANFPQLRRASTSARPRRRLTDAEKAKISRRMKTWRKRTAAAKQASKGRKAS